jgi:putative methyltransferase
MSHLLDQLISVTSVKKIVYSTCSIHPEEDEQVVMKALASKEAKAKGWTLAPRSQVLPKWHRRGRPSEMGDKEGMSGHVMYLLTIRISRGRH